MGGSSFNKKCLLDIEYKDIQKNNRGGTQGKMVICFDKKHSYNFVKKINVHEKLGKKSHNISKKLGTDAWLALRLDTEG